jgi:hypothetical protein
MKPTDTLDHRNFLRGTVIALTLPFLESSFARTTAPLRRP